MDKKFDGNKQHFADELPFNACIGNEPPDWLSSVILLEIAGCVSFESPTGEIYTLQARHIDKEPQFWSVYGGLECGSRVVLGDFSAREIAGGAALMIRAKIPNGQQVRIDLVDTPDQPVAA